MVHIDRYRPNGEYRVMSRATTPVDDNHNEVLRKSVEVSEDGTKYNLLTKTSSGSKVIFSQFSEALANGEGFDSGWIDMGGTDKYQFTGFASAPGMSLNVLSRASNTQTPLETPSTYDEGTFFLFNAIARQRYMRFTWTNNTGSTVTNVSMEIKQTFGSSDKLSVFPVNVPPTNFSQAALVQSILRGLDQDGNFVNVGVNSVGALNTSNFLLDVAREKYPEYRINTKFGRNNDLDTGDAGADIWHGGINGSEYTRFNATANENIEAFSSDVDDQGQLVSSGTVTSGTSTTITDSSATFEYLEINNTAV